MILLFSVSHPHIHLHPHLHHMTTFFNDPTSQQQRNQWTCLCSVLSVFLALVKISMMDMDTPMVIITRNKWTDTYFCPSLGWGKTTDAGISTETLQTAEVPIVEKSKCIERMNQEELEAGDENLLVCSGGTGVGPCKVETRL